MCVVRHGDDGVVEVSKVFSFYRGYRRAGVLALIHADMSR